MILSTGRAPFALALAVLLACTGGSEPSPPPGPPAGFSGIRIQQSTLSFQYPGEKRRIDAFAVDTSGNPMPEVRVALRIRDTSVFRLGLDGWIRARQPGDSWLVAEAFNQSDSIIAHFVSARPVWRIAVLVDALDVGNPDYGPADSIPARVEGHLDRVNYDFRSATTDGYLYFELERLRLLDSPILPERELNEPPSFRIAYDPTAVLRSGWYWDLTAHISGPYPDGMLGIWAGTTLVHELGHGRGAVDLYAQQVQVVENNPVTGDLYHSPPGIMSDMTGTWDPHSRFLINRNAAVLHVQLGGNQGEYPSEIIVRVRDSLGIPIPGVDMAIYPVTWYSYWVDPGAIVTGITDAAGNWRVSAPASFFDWANLHVVGRSGGRVYTGWIPYVEAQGQFFTAPADPYDITLVHQSGAGVTGTGHRPSPPRSVQEVRPSRIRQAEETGENRL